MKLTIESPTRAYIDPNTDRNTLFELSEFLTYTNTAKQYDVKRLYNNHWMRDKNPEAWKLQLEALKKEVKQKLIWRDADGRLFIRPGSIPYLPGFKYGLEVENKVVYPTPKKIPWAKVLPFDLYPYQEQSWQRLIAAKHGNVELTTGAGKTACLLKIARELGLPGAIIAPSKSIFLELVEKFEHHLGQGQIGKFGNGQKKIGKRFTICISDSLCNVKPGSPEWEFFSKLAWMGVDESHTWGAETLEEVCNGVLGPVPYRFFFSGTQTRGDGTEKLLQSLIGETVNTLSTADAVKGGYIAKHRYKIVRLPSSNPSFMSPDALEMKRKHFLGNKNICAFIAKLANATAKASGKQTLVLVEELSQISNLVKLLEVPFAYAHSESNAARLLELGLEKVKPSESVEKFNKNEAKVLIGTSCIATGTNIFPTHSLVNWVGGASEIRTKQGAVGRGVRLHAANPWAKLCVPKEETVIWDFDVFDVEPMPSHLQNRLEYYAESGSTTEYVNLA